MKILTSTSDIVKFYSGDVLDPRDINQVFNYTSDAIEFVSSKRYRRASITVPFVLDVANGLTEGSNSAFRTFRFSAPVNCIVESIYCSANYTSSAEVYISCTPSLGNLVGAVNPLITLPASADATITQTQVCVDNIFTFTGTDYDFVISCSGGETFTTQRFDLTLNILVDRWDASDRPSYEPTLINEASTVNASHIDNELMDIDNAVTLFGAVVAPVPVLFNVSDYPSDTDQRTLTIPRFFNGYTTAQISAVLLSTYITGSSSVVRANIRNESGSTINSVSTSSGTGLQSVFSSGLAIDLTNASSTISTTLASDYSVFVDRPTGVGTVEYARVLLWINP